MCTDYPNSLSLSQVLLGVGAFPLAWRAAGWVTGYVGLGVEYEVWHVTVCGVVMDVWSSSALSEHGLPRAGTDILHSDRPSVEYLLHICAGGLSWLQQASEVMVFSNHGYPLSPDPSVLPEGPG